MLNLIDRLVYWLALLGGGLVLLVLMGVTVTDVMFRYALNAPILGAQDMSTVLLTAVVAFSLAYGQRVGAHVAVDLFAMLLGPRFEFVSAVIVKLATASIAALWAWQLYLAGRTATLLQEGTLLLQIPFEPFYQALALGVAVYAFALLAEVCSLLRHGTAPLLEERAPPKERIAQERCPNE